MAPWGSLVNVTVRGVAQALASKAAATVHAVLVIGVSMSITWHAETTSARDAIDESTLWCLYTIVSTADLCQMPAKSLMRAVGEEVRACRLSKNWTQEQLAERAGLHINFIGLIERGKRMATLYTLEKIAAPFEMRVSALIARAERRISGARGT
jgi:DNA-binding XRE family transcriptional regulator